jgi:hypothetical protein
MADNPAGGPDNVGKIPEKLITFPLVYLLLSVWLLIITGGLDPRKTGERKGR